MVGNDVRVRFAPSPTGPLHIGGARSALFNWLFARKEGGKLVIRVEDTDLERSSRESEAGILDNLRWLGLNWDEGVDEGGEHGPYRQQERLHIYNPYVNKLLAAGQAYRCFCSEEDLAKEREVALKQNELVLYSGRCRSLSLEEVERRLSAGEKPAIRFRVPPRQKIVIDDVVRGRVTFDSDGVGDFIIVKSDGIPTYNFAVVVDDIEMKISHIIRGEEHLSNTPRQVLLYEALGAPLPLFAHISLILGEDRSKMSKRHGATSISAYRDMGYLPEALNNFLALLGWSPEGEEEIFTLDELIQAFSLKRVSKSPAVFNMEKLNWMNGHYMRKSPLEEILPLALAYMKEAGLITGEPTQEELLWLKEVLASVQAKMDYISQAPKHAAVYFGDTRNPQSEEAQSALKGASLVVEGLLTRVDTFEPWDEEGIKKGLKTMGKDLGVKGKGLFMPVRVAVSGQTWGPELPTLIRLLGKERVKKRLAHSLDYC